MSTENDLKETAALFARALTAIERVVSAVAGRASISPKVMAAADALQTVIAIVDTVKGALTADPAKRVAPELVKESLERLLAKIEDNDKTADDIIARRFEKG